MKPVTICSLAVSGALSAVIWCSQSATSQEQPAASERGIQALARERVEVLRELVADVTIVHEKGQGEVEQVIDALEMLLRARLELAESDAQRLRIHTEHLQRLQSLRSSVEKNIAEGNALRTDLLKVRAAILDARIELARGEAG